MTKLAHLHFTTNQQASYRVMAMGEEAWRVHTTGFPMVDLIRAGDLTEADRLYAQYGLTAERPIVLFTQHSVTTEADDARQPDRTVARGLGTTGGRGRAGDPDLSQ